MKKLLLYPHGGSGNHGCEAIVIATARILADFNEILLFSTQPDQDSKVGLNRICKIKRLYSPIRKFSSAYLRAAARYYLMRRKDAFDRLAFNELFQSAREGLALSIGGDNYCYGRPGFIYFINKYLRKQGVPTVLWGCSVEPEAIDNEMLEDLKGYRLIVARESITYEALQTRGLSQTKLFPDPAFQLDQVDEALPSGFELKNTVGVNVSPMVLSHEKSKGLALTNFIVLIENILKTTDMNIALIPHVIGENNNDLVPLRQLYGQFKGNGRVLLIGDHDCRVLKGYIARCRFFIGARTHATIAAYSSCVPTLVMGYSVKARGIARDLLGSEADMVLPVQSLRDENDLVCAFGKLRERESEIRSHLQNSIVQYKQRSLDAGKALKELAGP